MAQSIWSRFRKRSKRFDAAKANLAASPPTEATSANATRAHVVRKLTRRILSKSMRKILPKHKASKPERNDKAVAEPPRGYLKEHGEPLDLSVPLPSFLSFNPGQGILEEEPVQLESQTARLDNETPSSFHNNEVLPMDVLVNIFTYYATEESIRYPTETLLLVCKAWSTAALSHRALWGYFNIHISHRPPTARLSRLVKLRLERSGEVVPLCIELQDRINSSARSFADNVDHHILHMRETNLYQGDIAPKACRHTSCNCKVESTKCVRDLLTIFAGTDGLQSRRWKQLTVGVSSAWFSYSEALPIARAFSYPTPSLVSLSLRYLQIKEVDPSIPFFPSTPRLTELVLEDCILPSIVHTSSLRHADISWSRNSVASDEVFTSLEPSTKLKSLHLNLPQGADLLIPTEMNHLKEARFCGRLLPRDMETVLCPNITRLAIGVLDSFLVASLLNCHGIPFFRIKHLELWYEDVERDHSSIVRQCLADLLRSLTALEVFSGDLRMISLVLKLLWEASPPILDYSQVGDASSPSNLFGGRVIAFQDIQETNLQPLISRPDRRYMIKMARNLGALSPEQEWDVIFERLLTRWPHP